MTLWSRPLSPRARRAALMRLVSVDSGDEPIAPDLVEQLGLEHEAVAVRDEVRDDLEDLGLDRDQLTPEPELVRGQVHLEIPEHGLRGAHLPPLLLHTIARCAPRPATAFARTLADGQHNAHPADPAGHRGDTSTMHKHTEADALAFQSGLFAAIGRTPPAPPDPRIQRAAPPRRRRSVIRTLLALTAATMALAAGATPATGQTAEDLTVLTPVSGVAGVATGDSHSCAVTTDHHVLCWGGNESGQLGVGEASPHGGVHAVRNRAGTGPLTGADRGGDRSGPLVCVAHQRRGPVLGQRRLRPARRRPRGEPSPPGARGRHVRDGAAP